MARDATEGEIKTLPRARACVGDRAGPFEDILWALLNSTEFLEPTLNFLRLLDTHHGAAAGLAMTFHLRHQVDVNLGRGGICKAARSFARHHGRQLWLPAR